MVSFTGSTRAGEDVSKNAAATIKRVSLELGGKGANIVFADADEDAVARGARHCFNNSGQSCNAPTRMLVERAAYDRAVATAARIARRNRSRCRGKRRRAYRPGRVGDAARQNPPPHRRRKSPKARAWSRAERTRRRGSIAATSCARPSSPM